MRLIALRIFAAADVLPAGNSSAIFLGPKMSATKRDPWHYTVPGFCRLLPQLVGSCVDPSGGVGDGAARIGPINPRYEFALPKMVEQGLRRTRAGGDEDLMGGQRLC